MHGGRINVKVSGLDFRMFGGDGLPPFLPERPRIGHGVRLVDHDDLAPGSSEGVLDDPGDALVCVEVLLDGNLVFRAALEATTHADIQAFGVLAHDQEVDLSLVLAPQR